MLLLVLAILKGGEFEQEHDYEHEHEHDANWNLFNSNGNLLVILFQES
jgi:hypothetical protein